VSLLACSWLSPPRPGFRRTFAPCASTRKGGASGLDPEPFGWTKRRSSTSATNTIREHDLGSPEPRLRVKRACARARRPPAPVPRSRRPSRARSIEALAPASRDKNGPHIENGWCRRTGFRPRFPLRGRDPCGPRNPGRKVLSRPATHRSADVNRASMGCADDHQPRFHGPGAGMLWCQRSSRSQRCARGCPRSVFRARSPVRGHPRG